MNEQGHPKERFLLMEGGPLYRIEKRVGIIRTSVPITKRRALLAILLTWLPLLVFSLIQGTAYGNRVPVPFLHDFSVHTRFLLTVPLLLLAETVLGPRIAEAAEQFVTSEVVIEKDYERFDAAVARSLQLRDSVVAELVIALMAYTFSLMSFLHLGVHISSWSATRTDTTTSLTWAGWWLLGVCAPLLQFLILRWFWRLFLWFQFLAKICKFDIQLFPTHPDQAGGLGFVGEAQRFFGILLFAYSITICGVFANQIVYDRIPLQHFAPLIAIYVIMAVGIILGPLVIFTGKLLQTKHHGLYQYGALATSYTGLFHKKWIRDEDVENEPLLGTGDIQSLADLANSYAVIEKMNALPMSPRTLLQLIVASLLPMVPLLFTVMPWREVLKLLMKILV
jgi:hypothetical protein